MTSVQQTTKVGDVPTANGICSDVVCLSYTAKKTVAAVVADPATGEVPCVKEMRNHSNWRGRAFDGDINHGPGLGFGNRLPNGNHDQASGQYGLTPAGLQKILNNQAQLSLDMRQLDAAGVMARASEAESAAAASAVRAMESATQAGSASEVVEAAKPLLEAVQRVEARLKNMETRLTAIETQGASGCCVLM